MRIEDLIIEGELEKERYGEDGLKALVPRLHGHKLVLKAFGK